jgi:hypothetical protein
LKVDRRGLDRSGYEGSFQAPVPDSKIKPGDRLIAGFELL